MSTPELHTLKQHVSKGLCKAWPRLEAVFLEAAKAPGFSKYLANYRGLPEQAQLDFPMEAFATLREKAADAILAPIRSVFSEPALSDVIPALPSPDLYSLLTHCEESLNLALYYWHGHNDRNFQFRTLVHFFDLDGVGDEIVPGIGSRAVVSLNDAGFRFGSADSAHLPRSKSVASALGLEDVDLCNQRAVFAKLRTIAREICLLEEEWEHRNALMAVEYSQTRDAARKQGTKAASDLVAEGQVRMGLVRNHLACWCLETFIAVQKWLNSLSEKANLNPDVVAEMEAVEAVILSGLQKVFLPASVSRHRYSEAVMKKIVEWCDARQQSHADDFATALLRASLTQAIEPTQCDREVQTFLERRTSEWILSFDPCTPLKAFCWAISNEYHRFLTAVATIALARKMHPDSLDTFWFVNIGTLAEMPATFAPVDPSLGNPPFAKPDKERLHTFVEQACEALANARLDDETEEQRQPVQDLLRGKEEEPAP